MCVISVASHFVAILAYQQWGKARWNNWNPWREDRHCCGECEDQPHNCHMTSILKINNNDNVAYAQAEQEQNAATTLRVLDPCPEPCYLCKEYDEPDDPHPIVRGTTVGHCAKSLLLWHPNHVCGPCQAEIDALLARADGAGPTSAGAGVDDREACDGEHGHRRALDGVR